MSAKKASKLSPFGWLMCFVMVAVPIAGGAWLYLRPDPAIAYVTGMVTGIDIIAVWAFLMEARRRVGK